MNLQNMNNNLTLSITTIGDLLLRKTITITNGGEPIDDVSLCVPIYQRPYKWTARNAIQLLDDIIEAKNVNKKDTEPVRLSFTRQRIRNNMILSTVCNVP